MFVQNVNGLYFFITKYRQIVKKLLGKVKSYDNALGEIAVII